MFWCIKLEANKVIIHFVATLSLRWKVMHLKAALSTQTKKKKVSSTTQHPNRISWWIRFCLDRLFIQFLSYSSNLNVEMQWLCIAKLMRILNTRLTSFLSLHSFHLSFYVLDDEESYWLANRKNRRVIFVSHSGIQQSSIRRCSIW